eukprot:TRINITY_DN12_c0_g1_i1.p1 TRINITY_DN12_c0_g1~~TRINITY_DN12_c0_g1_i1.p1  ORF type:complete len:588 (-),score=91.33 TRINITY_DN12_c0_g1_i1:1059-2822(-)
MSNLEEPLKPKEVSVEDAQSDRSCEGKQGSNEVLSSCQFGCRAAFCVLRFALALTAFVVAIYLLCTASDKEGPCLGGECMRREKWLPEHPRPLVTFVRWVRPGPFRATEELTETSMTPILDTVLMADTDDYATNELRRTHVDSDAMRAILQRGMQIEEESEPFRSEPSQVGAFLVAEIRYKSEDLPDQQQAASSATLGSIENLWPNGEDAKHFLEDALTVGKELVTSSSAQSQGVVHANAAVAKLATRARMSEGHEYLANLVQDSTQGPTLVIKARPGVGRRIFIREAAHTASTVVPEISFSTASADATHDEQLEQLFDSRNVKDMSLSKVLANDVEVNGVLGLSKPAVGGSSDGADDILPRGNTVENMSPAEVMTNDVEVNGVVGQARPAASWNVNDMSLSEVLANDVEVNGLLRQSKPAVGGSSDGAADILPRGNTVQDMSLAEVMANDVVVNGVVGQAKPAVGGFSDAAGDILPRESSEMVAAESQGAGIASATAEGDELEAGRLLISKIGGIRRREGKVLDVEDKRHITVGADSDSPLWSVRKIPGWAKSEPRKVEGDGEEEVAVRVVKRPRRMGHNHALHKH